MIIHSSLSYGQAAENRINSTNQYSIEGARALVESFYYAFNHRDMEVFSQVWANDNLIQLNNPLGGILRGYEAIASLYQGIFTGAASVWVELSDIVEYQSTDMVIFAGREHGEFKKAHTTVPLSIRTTRIVQWLGQDIGWKQTHHHGSIDDTKLLTEYQLAVRG
jgi:ketosteroid isomerase-like protein